MNKTRLLEKKVCLVTGSSKGIGQSICVRFAEEGAIVYANGREKGSIDEWANECSLTYNTSVKPIYFDVCDFESVRKAVFQIKNEQEYIDVLVNNAGIVTYENLGMTDFEKLRDMFEVNVIAMIHLIQLTARLMSRCQKGSIINISSIVGVQGVKGQLGYSATKGAVISLTKSAAKELASQNIRVNTIAPGLVDTVRFRNILESKLKGRIMNIGMGRLATPVDIANACVFLASDWSEYISGQVISVDGCTTL